MNADADELPEGWAWSSLGDGITLDIQPGFACGAHNRDGEGIAHLRPMNVNEEGKIDFGNVKFVAKAKAHRDERLLRLGDVLFNNTNSPELVGKTACYQESEPKAFSNHMTRVRCNLGALDPQYCAFPLHHLWQQGFYESICNNHVSQASISRSVLLATKIAIPPLAEQTRIVAKVETLLARVNAARQRLAKVPALLKRFRQSVLAAACSGRLTEDWREDTSKGNELSGEWREACVGEILERIEAGKSFVCLPRRAEFNEWAVIKVSAMTWGKFDADENKAIPPDKHIDSRHEIRAGDLLFSRSNTVELAGATVVVGKTRSKLLLSDKSLRLIVKKGISTQWLHRTLQSPFGREQMADMATGTSNSMRNISQEKIGTIRIPLPPLAEQHEIVQRVEALLARADRIEKRLATASRRVETLTQAILAQAFRGELVPTEAELARREGRDYEPAAVLLERIRTQRETDTTKKRKGDRHVH